MQFLRSTFARIPKHQRFQYKPRYFIEEPLEQNKTIEFGAQRYFSGSKYNLVGAFKAEPLAYRDRFAKAKSKKGLILLFIMILVATTTYMMRDRMTVIAVGLFTLFVLLVILIRENNRV